MGRTHQLGVLAFAGLAATAYAGCPFLSGQKAQMDMESIGGERPLRHLASSDSSSDSSDSSDSWESSDSADYFSEGGADYSEATYESLKADLAELMTDSKDFWPADFGHYGGLMIRLAWHCAGNYRQSDGRGGCDGGRIRFNPERSWADNTNLDKALNLLEPLKLKYGDAVSWGDLIALTGNEAIRSMGGPVLGFCAGRQDDASGFASLELGPSAEQEAVAPCAVNGTCELPLGSTTVGLIYVNPEGPLGVPDPVASAEEIREVFSRMGMNDSETVALIGGGHAFGKFHGACETGPGADPTDAPEAPWPGTCGDPDSPTFGKAENTFTSGLEGQWTVEPTVWDNMYFLDLLEYDWVTTESPAGATQWLPVLKEGATETEDEIPDIVMLTTDVALLFDPEYLELVQTFADDQYALDTAFAAAWYKLMSRDMGQFKRCVGSDVAPPLEFQLPLPDAPADLPKYSDARESIESMLSENPSYGALFVTLAWRCMATFRSTDYLGGCNGARIRFSPEKDWAVNKGLDDVLELLEPVKAETPGISYADLIVFAGNIALKESTDSHLDLPFCKGRVDALEGDDLISVLEPREYDDVIVGVRDRMKIVGLSVAQMVALAARPRSASHMVDNLGFSGSYTTTSPAVLSNEYYNILLTETWEEVPGSDGAEYQAVGKSDVFALATDLALIWDPEFKAQSFMYATDNDLFLKEFSSAWTTLMNADRYDGPTGNVCY